MVAIAPFRALRYNLDVIGDLAAVAAPPYDVISAEEQDRLYQTSAYNIVRLILGKESPTDTPTENRYTRAKATLDQWRASGVLIRDQAPAIYLVEHAFFWQGRRLSRLGFVGLLEFAGSVPDQVLVHEATLEGPKADRTRLLEAVRAHLSPIFCITPDPSRQLHALLTRRSRTQQPIGEACMGDDEIRLWAMAEPTSINELQRLAGPTQVLIADGHHRFAVALAHRHLCPAVMSYVACLEDPALLVRPIHRVMRIGSSAQAAWRSQLGTLCDVEPAASARQLAAWLAEESAPGRFGYYEAGTPYQVSLREHVLAEWLMYPSVPLSLASLDVTILHELLVPRLLDRPSGTNDVFLYTPELDQAVALVDGRRGDCAWMLRPMGLPQVFALASQGVRLPPKSTFFYPKVLSGLVLDPFD